MLSVFVIVCLMIFEKLFFRCVMIGCVFGLFIW